MLLKLTEPPPPRPPRPPAPRLRYTGIALYCGYLHLPCIADTDTSAIQLYCTYNCIAHTGTFAVLRPVSMDTGVPTGHPAMLVGGSSRSGLLFLGLARVCMILSRISLFLDLRYHAGSVQGSSVALS